MIYYKDTRVGHESSIINQTTPNDSPHLKEITQEEYQEILEVRQAPDPGPEYEDLDVAGLVLKVITDNKPYNISITESYITGYNEDKELVDLGEITETSITQEQYKGLLKLRNQWRKP
tara:strand:+ start:6342 stop:6695 length:354 start_codon:yes stop_codon:yes gene_type:complete